jgi:hypothetical protein
MKRLGYCHSSTPAVIAHLCILAFVCLVSLAALAVAPVEAAIPRPHWNVTAQTWPTYFHAGDKGDVYVIVATNNGGGATSGPISIKATLPKGVVATQISANPRAVLASGYHGTSSCILATLTCTLQEPEPPRLDPQAIYEVFVTVNVPSESIEPVEHLAEVFGGEARTAYANDPTRISSLFAPFGVAEFSFEPTEMNGAAINQAGEHPAEIVTHLAFNISSASLQLSEPGAEVAGGGPSATSAVKDVEVSLPPGLVGNPNALPKCAQATFENGAFFDCPDDTQVGLLLLDLAGAQQQQIPVYDIEPPPGQPAELGFGVASFVHTPMFFHVHSAGSYGLTAQLNNISEAGVLRDSTLSLWGVPADPIHDNQRRGPECPSGGCASDAPLRPFLTLPADCSAAHPSNTNLIADTWEAPDTFTEGELTPNMPGLATASTSFPVSTGCEKLTFSPSISVAPEVTQASAPTGYTVSIRVPQTEDLNTLATPDLKRAVVTLPAGTALSSSASNGLEGCSEAQFGLHSTFPASCPPASQVGTVRITTPLLSTPLEGEVFVGTPRCGPCSPADASAGRLVRTLVQAKGSGVVIKLEGAASLNQSTGQLTSTFDENPQLPFDEFQLTFRGGARAPLANPSACGPATTTSDMTPWSTPQTPDVTPSSFFEVTGCAAKPFSPAFAAGTAENVGGGYGPFTATFSRKDSEQELSGVQITMPPGLLGMLSSVPLCGEPQAARGACPEASEIGHATVAAGAGSEPVYLPYAGQPPIPVYLTTGYDGAPFGLAVVTPAVAGPFNLGTVVVRATISVDPHTSQITITSEPLPTIRDGIPLHVQLVNVTADRPRFIFNPTTCQPLSVTGALASAQGAIAHISRPFEAADCANLAFKPRFTMATAARASKIDGVSLDVKVTARGGPGGNEANIRSVKVDLPRQLPSRLTTLQKACSAAIFEADPAACPKESDVGTATAATPVLAHPLTGPAYLVSHGGAAFPDLEIILQGEGIQLILDGATSIQKGVTSSTFRTVPDAPIGSFELKLPAGRYSVLTAILPAGASSTLCGQRLTAPTAIAAQNGAIIKQNTKIAITGCTTLRRAPATQRKKSSARNPRS